jgi:hypothetical protein
MGEEVAAIIHAQNGLEPGPRSFYIKPRGEAQGSKPTPISIFSPLYEPFCYPMLHFSGELGWHKGYTSTTGKRLTMREYYKARLLQNQERFAAMGQLLGEYCVDAYS